MMNKRKRIYKYDESFVAEDKITIDAEKKDNLRFLLELPFKTSEKGTQNNVLVILKNPSWANDGESDHTINNVLKFCFKNNFNKVFIMNLFPYCSTKPKVVKTFINNKKIYNSSMKYNLGLLETVTGKVSDVIIAWGTDTIGCGNLYDETINEVNNIIKRKTISYVQSKSKKGYPRHGQIWSVNQDICMIKC